MVLTVQDTNDLVEKSLLEQAWGLIANANEGNWDKATPEWKGAAERWRDKWFATLPACSDGPCPEKP